MALTVAGGVLAGVLALVVGGLPLLWSAMRSVKALRDEIDDLDERHTREVKKRAAAASTQTRKGDDELLALLAARERNGAAPGSVAALPPHEQVRERAKQKGII